MAKKSSNTQGNPYHDEETGEFTSSEKVSTSQNDSGKFYSIRFKSNVDLSAAKSALQQQPAKNNNSKPIGKYKEATSIEEAVAIGKSILPDCAVNYSDRCDLSKVNELNKSLSDIANRFPGFVQNGLLNAYGDGLSLDRNELKDIVAKSALNVIKNDKHFSKLYDEFFNYSKGRYNLKDEDKYSEQVLSHFMCFDRQFDMNDYTRNFTGVQALAYYQVSQRNIFNSSQGGGGINGAIKIYAKELQKATPREINMQKEAVEQGFHFDYGEHSYTYGMAVHELGHSIFTIAYKKCNDQEREELDKLLLEGVSKDRKEVSGYGRTNFYEQEAESVADVMCRGQNATPHNQKMVAWLDKIHKRLKDEGEI